MATIKIDRLTMAEAEAVIAEIWKCLEEHNLESPSLSLIFRRGGHVGFSFGFDEPLGAELAAQRLSAWHAVGGLPAAIAAPGSPGGCEPYSGLAR